MSDINKSCAYEKCHRTAICNIDFFPNPSIHGNIRNILLCAEHITLLRVDTETSYLIRFGEK